MNLILVTLGGIVFSFVEVDESLKKRFLEEFPAALARAEDRCSKIKGLARISTANDEVRRSPGNPVQFAVNSPSRKFEFSLSATLQSGTRTLHYVYCLAGDKSFNLQREGDRPYSIKGLGGDMVAEGSFRTIFGKYLDASWSSLGGRYSDLLKSKNFKITKIVENSGTGINLVDVEFEAGQFNGTPLQYKIRLDPANDWAVIESELRLGPPPLSEVVKIDYGSNRVGGSSYPSVITFKGIDGKRERCEFERVDFDSVNLDEFQIEYYGLRDVSSTGWDWLHRVLWWLVATGIIALLLVGSVIFKKMANRRR